MRIATVILAVMSLSVTAFANDSPYDKNHMAPFSSEKLPSPINLSDNCAGVQVIEWRPTIGQMRSTYPSEKAKATLNEICNLAVKNFRKFILSHNYIIGRIENFSQSVSLLPADIYNHGADLRNLNDSSYRFFNRYKEYDENGDVIPIWGYHSRSTSHIFIRNDVLAGNGKEANLEFKTIFAHELFHAMSYQFGIFNQHSGNQTIADEKMARRFTKFLGLGE